MNINEDKKNAPSPARGIDYLYIFPKANCTGVSTGKRACMTGENAPNVEQRRIETHQISIQRLFPRHSEQKPISLLMRAYLPFHYDERHENLQHVRRKHLVLACELNDDM